MVKGLLELHSRQILQDDDGRLIAKIEGSVSNVIGLPMERLGEVLRGAQRLQE